MRKKTKLFSNQAIRSVDVENRTAEYIISTDEVDRMGEIVEQSWDLENYKQNPIVLWGHDPNNQDNVVGTCLSIETEEEEGRTVTRAKVKFAEEGTSAGADTVWKLVKQGILRTVSVGFIPKTFKSNENETPILADNELLEFSIVAIPANPGAVALAYGDDSITEEDARWLAKQYKSETDFLEKSLYDTMTSKNGKNETPKDKERSMSDEEITKLAEAVGTAVTEALAPKLDEILEAVGAKDEEKPEESETPDTPAEEEEPKKSAKSEQDEGGALEFDENEELDEEQQKAFTAALEKLYADKEGK